MLLLERLDDEFDGLARGLDLLFAAGEGTEGGGDADGDQEGSFQLSVISCQLREAEAVLELSRAAGGGVAGFDDVGD